MLVDSIRDQLIKVFTPPQAEILAEVVVKTHDTLATRSDMHELRVAMRELADQQKLTSAEVQALGEQQQLTSRAVHELAEQQRLTSAEVRELAEQQRLTSAEVRALGEQQQLTSRAVRELAEQQRLTSAEVRALAEQQKGMDVELGDLKSTVSELTSAVGELKSSVGELKSSVGELRSTVGELSSTVGELAASVRTLDTRTNKTAGWALEWLVGKHLPAYVGRAIKRCRVVGPMDVIESLETRQAMRELTAEELDDLRRVDLIATGNINGEKIYLVGEVSYTAHNDDVLRAARRAAVLRRIGERSQPFVACDVIAPVSAELANREGVWVIREGRLLTSAA